MSLDGIWTQHSGKRRCNHLIHLTHRRGCNHLKSFLEWEPISDRLIRARFNSDHCKLSIIQCYAPTNDTDDEIKENFFEQLQATISKIPQHDMLLVMGDLNVKIGSDNTDYERYMGVAP